MNLLHVIIALYSYVFLQIASSASLGGYQGIEIFLSSLIVSCVAGIGIIAAFGKSTIITPREYVITATAKKYLYLIINLVSTVALLSLIIFVWRSIPSLSLANLALFSERYRNGFYKGSGLYTGLGIYFLPICISYVIIVERRFKKLLILPVVSVLVFSLTLGLRIFIVPIALSLIVLSFLKKSPSFESAREQSARIFGGRTTSILIIGASMIGFSSVVKGYLSSAADSYEGDNILIGALMSIFSRINYPLLLSAVNPSKSYSDSFGCVLPIASNLLGYCKSLDDVKYNLVSSSFLKYTSGTFSGFAIPSPIAMWSFSAFWMILFISLLPSLLLAGYSMLLRSAPFSFESIIGYCAVTMLQMGLVEDSFTAASSFFYWVLYLVSLAFILRLFSRTLSSKHAAS
jgi:hypothetical protein